jgi:hypothetical protein
MLESMAANTQGILVSIAECSDMHQPRASLTDGAMGHLGDVVLLQDGSASKLYAVPQYFARPARDIRSLTDGLWGILGDAISRACYSYRTGDWQPFDNDDRQFIGRALQDDDA